MPSVPITVGALFLFTDTTMVLTSLKFWHARHACFLGFSLKFYSFVHTLLCISKTAYPTEEKHPFPPSRRKAEEYLVEKKRDLDRAVRADPVQFPKRERIENAAYERVESLHARTQENELIPRTAQNRLTGRSDASKWCFSWIAQNSAGCTSQQKVDTEYKFSTPITIHDTLCTVSASDSSVNRQGVLH